MRYQALRKSVLSNKAINSYIDQHAKLLAPCINRHFEAYPELFGTKNQTAPLGFAGFGGFPQMGQMPGFGSGNMISWFAAYRVQSYDEEIKVLKQWLADRLSFLDRNIARFDKDWQPRIQELKEIKAPQFGGFGGF
jgi:hypothetical protein